MKSALLAALFGLTAMQAQAGNDPTLLEVYPGASSQLKGDGSSWEMTVSTVYKDNNGKLVTKPAYTLKTTSGQCAFGRDQVLDMKGDFKVKVVDQFCVGSEKGDQTYVGAWMTSPYPKDAADWPTQDEAHFVYGERIDVRMDKVNTSLRSKSGVFEYSVRRL
jgi:hypothetical protein